LIGDELLEPSVLAFELLQALRLVHPETTVLLAPANELEELQRSGE
jgi:hypothetical protein